MDEWRISKSGWSIKAGWGELTRIIACYSGKIFPFDKEKFEKWYSNADLICDIHNQYLKIGKPENIVKTVEDLLSKTKELEDKLKSLQAKLDSLMLEYCPDKMTKEQIDNWAKHQQPYEER